MREGQEGRLEQSLSIGQQHLPWRSVLKSVRRISGVSELERAEKYMDALAALALVRRLSGMPREPGRRVRIDLGKLVTLWGVHSKTELAAVFSNAATRRLKSLMDRHSNIQAPSLWVVNIGDARALVFGRGTRVIAEFERLFQSQKVYLRTRLFLQTGAKHMLLDGRYTSEGSYELRFFAARPRFPELLKQAGEK
jgi:hypothetical protein